MISEGPLLGGDPRLLKIGEAAALTGVSQGRIRHYQRRGLVRPGRSLSGYRYFGADDLLRLLQIDLLRGLGMGLEEIRRSLPGQLEPGSLGELLRQHRATLLEERGRLQRLLDAIDAALETPGASAETVASLLAAANARPGESLGIFGRLSRPLSAEAAQVYRGLLGGGWGLPVPSIFGRLLLPAQVSELLEQVARAPGHPVLFQRIRLLAAEIVRLAQDPDPGPAAAAELAEGWLRELASDPLPQDVQRALDSTLPRIGQLDLLNQGFRLWASSISPLAAEFLLRLQAAAGQRAMLVLGVLVARAPRRSRRRRANSSSP